MCKQLIATFILAVQPMAVSVYAQTAQESAITNNDVYGTAPQRVLRLWQYSYQYAEQPSQILLQSTGGSAALTNNPEHNLNQHTVSLDFSQIFLTSQQLSQALVTWRSVSKSAPIKMCEKAANLITCVANGGGWWKRALSGLKVSGSASEHVRAVQQILRPSGYGFASAVDFDPAHLFVTGADWKNASALIDKLTPTEIDKLRALTASPCTSGSADSRTETVNCAGELRSAWARGKWLAIAMIPTFQYKRQTPFDFLKASGTLVPSSNESGLNSWTLSVDMRRVVASPNSQADAIAAASAVRKKLLSPNAAANAKVCATVAGTFRSYISVQDNVAWDSCAQIALQLHADYYQLGCASDNQVSFGDHNPLPHSGGTPNLPKDDTCKW